MGLDMYLSKRSYVKNWDFMKPQEKHSIVIKKGGKLRKDINPKKVEYIIESAGYWRKANAIHNWFVENVQNGEDNCGEYSVRKEQLENLLELVNKVLLGSELIKGKIQNGSTIGKDGKTIPIMEDGKNIKDPSIAKELLPVTSGFFFGGTNYDEYYYSDLEDTKKILTEALKDEYGEYLYHSSW